MCLADSREGRGLGQFYNEQKRELQDWSLEHGVAGVRTSRNTAISYDWCEEHIWFSLVGHDLKIEAKTREAGGY